MKKILAFILAALTVFSTVGFAAPTVEVTENSEEITETGRSVKISLADKAALSEDTVDYYSALYGIKDWFYTAETDSSASVDENGVTYVNVTLSSKAPDMTNPSSDKIYTYFEKVYEFSDQTVKLRNGGNLIDSTVCIEPAGTNINVPANKWTEYKYVLQLTDAIAENIKSINVYHGSKNYNLAYNGLYYKPAAKITAEITSRVGKTVTVSYPEGIETEAAKALSVYYNDYYNGKIKEISVEDKQIVITFKDVNVVNVVLPELVNADKTASYNEVDLTYEVDRFAIFYGIRDWFFNAQDVANASFDEDGIAYVNVTGSARQGTRTNDLTTDRVYTFIEKSSPATDEEVRLRESGSAFLTDSYFLSGKNAVKFSANVWNEYINSFKLDEAAITRVAGKNYPDAYHTTGSKGTFRIAYNGLYYKPAAAAEAAVISRSGNDVTVSYPEGIEAEAANALVSYYDEYFRGKVTAISVGEDQITVTLSDATAENVIIPALVNAAKDKTYNNVNVSNDVDRLAIYGIQDWYFNAENAANAITDSEGNTYIIAQDKAFAYFATYTKSSDRSYTYIENLRNDGSNDVKDGVDLGYASLGLRYHDANGSAVHTGTFGANYYKDVFTEITVPFTLTEEIINDETNIKNGWPDVYHNSRYISTKYAGIYYKPLAQATAPTVTIISKVSVTVTYPDGIYEDTAKALEAYYTKYFDGNVKSLKISGNTVILTLASDAAEFEIPSLVSADGEATSAAVTIITDLDPKTADEIDYSEVHSGIRFKASVTAEQKGQAVEYGWIVARKITIGDSELTFKLDNSTGKTFVSAIAFGKTTDNEVIDKWLTNDGSTIVFSGVVMGIPEGMENDVIVARPYIKYTQSGDVFYGTAKESALSAVKA